MPFPQFAPTTSAPASRRSCTAFSGVTPIIVKNPLGPRSKTIVANTGSLVFSLAALIPVTASSNAICVSISMTSAPPSASAVICSASASYISDALTPSGSGSIISPVGPTEAATKCPSVGF